jgi:hypothetical protein
MHGDLLHPLQDEEEDDEKEEQWRLFMDCSPSSDMEQREAK